MAHNAVHRLRDVKIDNAAGAGDTTLFAAPANNQRITVINYALIATGAVAVKFKSNTTDKTGAMSLGANGGLSFVGQPESPAFQCAAGEALILNAGGAVQVSGHAQIIVEE